MTIAFLPWPTSSCEGEAMSAMSRNVFHAVSLVFPGCSSVLLLPPEPNVSTFLESSYLISAEA